MPGQARQCAARHNRPRDPGPEMCHRQKMILFCRFGTRYRGPAAYDRRREDRATIFTPLPAGRSTQCGECGNKDKSFPACPESNRSCNRGGPAPPGCFHGKGYGGTGRRPKAERAGFWRGTKPKPVKASAFGPAYAPAARSPSIRKFSRLCPGKQPQKSNNTDQPDQWSRAASHGEPGRCCDTDQPNDGRPDDPAASGGCGCCTRNQARENRRSMGGSW